MNDYQRLRILREDKGFTQETFAFRVGINQSAYAKIEQGNTQITTGRLLQFSEILGVHVCDILGIENKPTEPFCNAEKEAMQKHIESLQKMIDKLLSK